LVGKKLYFSTDFDNENFCYDPETQSVTQLSIKGALYIHPGYIVRNNKEYVSVSVYGQSDHQYEDLDFIVYNLSDGKEVKLSYEYRPFQLYSNNFLVSEDPNGPRWYSVIHRVNSFEPEDMVYIIKLEKSVTGIFEDDQYIYTISNDSVPVDKIRKSDNKVVAAATTFEENSDAPGGIKAEFKNGYFWFGARKNSGEFYRVETADDDGDGVLKWQLIKK